LKIALATCTALSADHVLRSRLGDDFPAVVGVSSTGVEGENRYGHLDVELVLDMSELDETKRANLPERVARTSDRQCTVGRTLKAGATYDVTGTNGAIGEPSGRGRTSPGGRRTSGRPAGPRTCSSGASSGRWPRARAGRAHTPSRWPAGTRAPRPPTSSRS